jgi:hypothetical protein
MAVGGTVGACLEVHGGSNGGTNSSFVFLTFLGDFPCFVRGDFEGLRRPWFHAGSSSSSQPV